MTVELRAALVALNNAAHAAAKLASKQSHANAAVLRSMVTATDIMVDAI